MSKANSVFQQWLKRKETSPKKDEAVPPAHKEIFPLSSEQIRLWIHEQLYPDNPVYNFVTAYSFSGEIALEALQLAIEKTFAKFPILNCQITTNEEGIFHQQRKVPITIDVVKINEVEPDKAKQLATEKAKTFGRKVFNLEEELARGLILSLNRNEIWFVFAVHHIIFDKQSTSILIKDIAANYYDERGKAVFDKPAKIDSNDFADYIAVSKQEAPAQTKEYWKKQFSELPQRIEWPFKQTATGKIDFKGSYLPIEIPDSCLNKLTAIAQNNHTSLFVVVLSLYKVFLSIYLGSNDICVGVPVTNRIGDEWQNTIGFFDNSLPVRSSIDLEKDFIAQLLHIKQNTIDTLSHKDLPFHELVKLVVPSRNAANPIFQTMLIYHEAELDWTKAYPFNIEEVRLDLGVSKFDLSLYCQKSGNHFEMIFEIAHHVFNDEQQNILKAAFENYLTSIIDHSTIPLASGDWLNTKVTRHKLNQWNTGERLNIKTQSITELFLQQVTNTPQAIAISDGTSSFTYASFNQAIELLSKQLSESGISAGMTVGVCLERGINLVIAIYAIQRLGAAYLPIDPEYPVERINQMIEISEANTVITTPDIYRNLSLEPAILLNDSNIEVKGRIRQGSNFVDGAYILFTSGSTGKPKGVKISQYNLVHSTQNRFHFYKDKPANFLLIPSISFDSSVAGLFWPLCTGGTLFVPPKMLEHDMHALSQYIQANEINSMLLLPSLYKVLLQNSPKKILSSLRTVIVAGESTTTDLVALHYEILNDCDLVNEYGPTEATVWCSACYLTKEMNSVPIGKPIANTKIYLLNSSMQPVLPGHIGEIYIAGAGIASGYINNEQLTKSSFIPSPFHINETLYKTGDLGRFDDVGNLYFWGRKDQQIKINGKRVELEEITQATVEIAGVEQAIVLFQEIEKSDAQKHTSAEIYLNEDAVLAKETLQQLLLKEKGQLEVFYKNLT